MSKAKNTTNERKAVNESCENQEGKGCGKKGGEVRGGEARKEEDPLESRAGSL